jgi:lipid-binding SYLF domain-containing protein
MDVRPIAAYKDRRRMLWGADIKVPQQGEAMMRASRVLRQAVMFTVVCMVWTLSLSTVSHAATAQEIDASANAALAQFGTQVKGGEAFLESAKGTLIFPEVIQAGFGIGGEYGEGVLSIGGKSVAYYGIAAGSIGFQLGAQRKSVVVAFMTDQGLSNCRAQARTDNSWQVGVEGSIALLNLGAQASVNSATINQPIVGFIFAQQGLMYDLSLEGSKITQLIR